MESFSTILPPEDRVTQLCQELVVCVMKLLDPSSTPEERIQHNQTIESFKEGHELCMRCGFKLVQDQNPVARHFGLQLVEHMIKHRWETMTEQDRQEYLQLLLKFMTEGVSMTDEAYVKEALARLTIETAKKMWPQKWETFMIDLNHICRTGPPQVELVLIIFRRLAEDIHLYDSGLDQRRKKEMSTALNEEIKTVFRFLLQNMECDESGIQVHLRQVALSTMCVYVEWVEFDVILLDNCKLLHLLYCFLHEESLKVSASECLLHILARKGDVKRTAEHRHQLLQLLSKDNLTQMWATCVKATQAISDSLAIDEQQYMFLKRMCQVLVHLGTSQLGPLWSIGKDDFTPPEDFNVYMNIILEFTNHNSQLLSMTSADVWSSFINHNHIKENKVFKDFMPNILSVCRKKLMKLGDPGQVIHVSSAFARIDFDGADEFTLFFSSYRCKMSRIVTQLALMNPRTAAKEAVEVLRELVKNTTAVDYTKNSMEYLQWDGFVSYLECWTNTFKSDPTLPEIDIVKECGLEVLKQLVLYNTKATLILQCQFRSLQSGLLFFLHFDTGLFEEYIQKIFNSVGFMGGGTDKYDLTKEVVTTRNSIITCFTHLCDAHQKILAPHIKYLTDVYKQLLARDELVYAEKCSFMEALIILSMESHSVVEQSEFLGFLLSEVNTLFSELQSCVSSVQNFISCFCLDKDPSDPSYIRGRRLGLCYIIHSVSLVLKRATPTSLHDPQQHPTFPHILPLVINFCIPILSVLYQLWSGQYEPLLAEHFKGLEKFHPFERDNVLGRTMTRRAEEVSKGEVRTLQMNLAAVHEGCLQSVSRSLVVYGTRYLYEGKMVELALNAVFPAVLNLNYWRLRSVLRHLISPIVSSCPPDCWDDVLYPFLSYMCHLVYTRLRESWDIIQQRKSIKLEDGNTSDEKTESEEVFYEQLTTVLSREFSNLLELVCMQKIEGGKQSQSQDGDDGMEVNEEMASKPEPEQQQSMEKWSLYCCLTPLAVNLLETKPEMREVLFAASFCGLAWNDTHTANKCTNVAGLIYVKFCMPKVNMGALSSAVSTGDIFMQVLSALHIHGIHDHVRSQLSFLALLIYQSAYLEDPSIQKILLETSQVGEAKVKAFNKMLEKRPPATVKVKKEKFKELITNIIGKHIGEAYKHKLTFDLPEMEIKRKAKQDNNISVDLSNLFS